MGARLRGPNNARISLSDRPVVAEEGVGELFYTWRSLLDSLLCCRLKDTTANAKASKNIMI